MTLGDFRKITEQYDDDCPLFCCTSGSNLCNKTIVDRVIVDVMEPVNPQEPMTPKIIVL